jgi:rhodanese-related sulfurtransferase
VNTSPATSAPLTPETQVTRASFREELSLPVFKAASLIVILAVFSGLCFSFAVRRPPASLNVPDDSPPAWETFSDFERLEGVLENPDAFVLDARSPALYAIGRIPGAMSLSVELLDQGDQETSTAMDSVPRNALVTVYCSDSLCPLAERLAGRLTDSGFTRVQVFTPGFDAWLDSGRDIEEDPLGS